MRRSSALSKKEKGNVLFLILIAVALFAALSYAVTRSSRDSGKGITAEKSAATASAILDYGASLRQAYQKIRIVNGCAVQGLSQNQLFGNPGAFAGKCNIFDKSVGGGVAYNVYPANISPVFGTYSDPPYPGKSAAFFNTMAVYNLGTTKSEPVFFLFNIKAEICDAINKLAEIKTADGLPPLEDSPYEGGWNAEPTSGYNQSLTIGRTGSGYNELAGHDAGCYRAARGSTMGYHFYYVLETL